MNKRLTKYLVVGMLLIGAPCIYALTDWQVGPAAAAPVPGYGLSLADASYGVDARFRISAASGSLLTLFCQDVCSQENPGVRVSAFTGIGAVARISPLRFGIYAGPRIGYFFQSINSNPHIFDASLAFRITGDMLFGPFSLGASYIMDTALPLDQLNIQDSFSYIGNHQGQVSISFLALLR